MKLKDMYELAVKLGMEADPRPMSELKDDLARRKKKYDKLEKKEKEYFDVDSLTNPYYDSRLLHANNLNDEVKTMMVGIDMEQSELMLAAELTRRGQKIDLVLAHHPEGHALLGLGHDMDLQHSVNEICGVPVNVSEKILAPRKGEIHRGVHPTNFIRPMHTAKLLGMNYMCTHTITDNMAFQFVDKHICKKKKYHTVGDVVEALMEIPEYQMASKLQNPPIIVCGSADARAGRVEVTEFTGGTSGNEAIYAKLSAAGVGTIIAMHMGEKHRKEAEANNINVIVAGHMASDSLGVNQLLDKFEEKGVKIIPCGMFRVSRAKKGKK